MAYLLTFTNTGWGVFQLNVERLRVCTFYAQSVFFLFRNLVCQSVHQLDKYL